MAKIVISAQIDLPAEKREEALRTAQKWIDGALSQDGCIHYDWSADLNNPRRVNVFEEWKAKKRSRIISRTGNMPVCWRI